MTEWFRENSDGVMGYKLSLHILSQVTKSDRYHLRYFGHIKWQSGLERTVKEGMVPGRQGTG